MESTVIFLLFIKAVAGNIFCKLIIVIIRCHKMYDLI